MMSKMPVAGVVWQTAHYLLGLERLGHEAYYVEAHARTPSMLMETEEDDGSARAAAFIDRFARRFGLAEGRWAYHALHEPEPRCFGMSETALRELYSSADMLINLHGGTEPRPEHAATGRLVYLETDPVCTRTARKRYNSLRRTSRFSRSRRITDSPTASCRYQTVSSSSRRGSRS
jgi:hypothetical protein